MLVKRVGRAALDAPWRIRSVILPSTFILPQRARITTTSSSTDPNAAVETLDPHRNPHAATPDAASITPPPPIQQQALPSAFIQQVQQSRTPPSPPPSTGPLPASVTSLLPSLAIQKPHYATIHLHDRPYLVTAGDRVRLPFLMPAVEPGDVLRLTNAATVGSRDFTLRGAPWVDSRLFLCRAVVAAIESEPMRVMEKTKRRNRKVKKVKSKHRYTELVIQELRIKTLEEIMADEMADDARS